MVLRRHRPDGRLTKKKRRDSPMVGRACIGEGQPREVATMSSSARSVNDRDKSA